MKAAPGPCPNLITLLRLAALPFFLCPSPTAGSDRAGAVRRRRHLGRRRWLSGPALRHEVRARRVSRPDRRQAPADLLVSVPRHPVVSGRGQGARLAGRAGALAGFPAAPRGAADDPLEPRSKTFPPTWAGKVTTVTQIVTVLFVLCANVWNWPRPVMLIAFGATATATIYLGLRLRVSGGARRLRANGVVAVPRNGTSGTGADGKLIEFAPSVAARLSSVRRHAGRRGPASRRRRARWEIVDVDSDDEIARRWSDSIPVLFVNGRLFAKLRLPKLAAAAAADARGGRGGGRGRAVIGFGAWALALVAAAGFPLRAGPRHPPRGADLGRGGKRPAARDGRRHPAGRRRPRSTART